MKKQREKLSFIERMIQGAVGKRYVIKHYRYGAIKTKFPDMTKIIASPCQRKCRNLFREAVAYALAVIADKEKKKAWQKRLRRRNGVYNEAIKAYMLKEKLAKERENMLTRQLIRNAFKNETAPGVTPAVTQCPIAPLRKIITGHYKSPGKVEGIAGVLIPVPGG